MIMLFDFNLAARGISLLYSADCPLATIAHQYNQQLIGAELQFRRLFAAHLAGLVCSLRIRLRYCLQVW
jgi:hypothetical protein